MFGSTNPTEEQLLELNSADLRKSLGPIAKGLPQIPWKTVPQILVAAISEAEEDCQQLGIGR